MVENMDNKEIVKQISYKLSYIESAYEKFSKAKGLNYNSLMMMCIISENEGITQSRIGEFMHLPKTTVHSILLEFIKHGDIVLEAKADNKKEKSIVMTKKGKEYFEDIVTTLEELEDRVATKLTTEKCLQIMKMAQDYGTLLNEEVSKYMASQGSKSDE